MSTTSDSNKEPSTQLEKHDLKGAKTLITHDKDHTKADFELHESALSNRTRRLQNKASGLGAFSDDDFTSARRKTSTADIKRELEEHKSLTDQLNDLKKDGLASDRLERSVNRDLEKLKRKAGKVFEDMNAVTEHHGNAMQEITLDEQEFLKKLKEDFGKKSEALSSKITKENRAEIGKQYEQIKANYDRVVDVTKDRFDKARQVHVDARKDAEGIIADLEKATGMNAADHLPSKAVVAAEKGAAKAAEQGLEKAGGSVFSRMGQNLKGGFGGKVKVGLGVLAGGGLAVSGFKDLAGRTDEQGKPVETSTFVGLVKVAGGLIGGAMLAGHR